SVSVGHSLQRVDAILSATDRQLLNRVAQAAKQLGGVAEQLERSQLVANLSRAAGDLAEMTTYARAGGGTIGALVKDPTVYEQLVQILGGVGRSRLLRALVRFAISRDVEPVRGRVVDEPPPR